MNCIPNGSNDDFDPADFDVRDVNLALGLH